MVACQWGENSQMLERTRLQLYDRTTPLKVPSSVDESEPNKDKSRAFVWCWAQRLSK